MWLLWGSTLAGDVLLQRVRWLNSDKLKGLVSSLTVRGLLWTLAVSFLTATSASMIVSMLLLRRGDPGRDNLRATAHNTVAAQNLTAQSLSPTEVERIVKRNIFNSEGKVGDETAEVGEEVQPEGDSSKAVKTDLPLKLVGVIFGGTPLNGLAMIENTAKRAINSFVVGDMVIKGAKLAEVYNTRAILDRGGRREFLDMEVTEFVRNSRERNKKKPATNKADEFTPIASGPPPENFKEDGFQRDGANIQITSAWKENMLTADFTKVLQDAKAEPNVVDGEVKGFRLTRIRESSAYLKAGFQNNDVVEEINGVPLKDAANAIRLLQQLKSAPEIEVRVNRGGNSFNMNIQVK